MDLREIGEKKRRRAKSERRGGRPRDLRTRSRKRPRGEDPPTEFLCVCRGPSVDSTNSLVGLRSGIFSKSSPRAKSRSPNYHRCDDRPGTSTDAYPGVPGDKCSFVLSNEPTYKVGPGEPRARCAAFRNAPRGATLPPLIPPSYYGLLDRIWQ